MGKGDVAYLKNISMDTYRRGEDGEYSMVLVTGNRYCCPFVAHEFTSASKGERVDRQRVKDFLSLRETQVYEIYCYMSQLTKLYKLEVRRKISGCYRIQDGALGSG